MSRGEWAAGDSKLFSTVDVSDNSFGLLADHPVQLSPFLYDGALAVLILGSLRRICNCFFAIAAAFISMFYHIGCGIWSACNNSWLEAVCFVIQKLSFEVGLRGLDWAKSGRQQCAKVSHEPSDVGKFSLRLSCGIIWHVLSWMRHQNTLWSLVTSGSTTVIWVTRSSSMENIRSRSCYL